MLKRITATVTVAALLAALAVAADAAVRRGDYKGQTRQDARVSFRVLNKKQLVRYFLQGQCSVAAGEGTCSSKGSRRRRGSEFPSTPEGSSHSAPTTTTSPLPLMSRAPSGRPVRPARSAWSPRSTTSATSTPTAASPATAAASPGRRRSASADAPGATSARARHIWLRGGSEQLLSSGTAPTTPGSRWRQGRPPPGIGASADEA